MPGYHIKSIQNQVYAVLVLLFFINLSIVSEALPPSAPAAANLDLARNGTDASPNNPISWVNGNANGSQAHFLEGMSISYRCVFTNVTAGVQNTLTMGYDIKNSSKNAIDYLTHYNRPSSHYFAYHSTAETIDPLAGTGLSSASYTTYPIPAPSSSGSTVAGQPGTSFNSLSASDRYMTLYNGTIDTIYYSSEGSLSSSTSETQIVIKFTPSAATAVLLWGGHIASRSDWGYSNGSPHSAGGISGSPFHMRLKSWSVNNVGSQDRSLSGDAVGSPIGLPVELLAFDGHAEHDDNELNWATATETNSDYFILEKSRDGKTFQKMARLKAAGNTTTSREYNFTDKEPYFETTYYRLVEVDYDGRRNDYGTIAVLNKNYRISNLTIYNLNGVALETIKNPAPNASYSNSNLPEGFYIFQYITNKGVVVKRRFIASALLRMD